MLTHATIYGLKSTPKQFRWGTILRILRKHGADRQDINQIHRSLNRGLTAHFQGFQLCHGLVSDQELH